MGSLPLWKGATMRAIRIQNNQWSLEHCPVLCIVHFAALFAQKCDHLTPPPNPNPYISETAFSHRFQKVYTYPPPPTGRNFGALDKIFIQTRKSAITHHVAANQMSPRDIEPHPKLELYLHIP